MSEKTPEVVKAKAQSKIDKLIEDKQLKYFNKEYFDKKIRLETENSILGLELQNKQLKEQLKHLSPIKPIT